MKKFLRTQDVAEMTGLAVSTVYSYLHRRIIPPPRERIGGVGLLSARCSSLHAVLRRHGAAQRAEIGEGVT